MTDVLTQLRAALGEHYVVQDEIGRGGMATVYAAEDRKHRRRVAIKVLHPELAAVLGAERFLREIEIAAGLQHPHILPLYDSGRAVADDSATSQGLLFYVMPFVEGESLRDRLRRESQLSVDDALQIAREVADGLGYAHSLGIIHRDIKPENILMSNGHALIADFGIARAVREAGGERLTETGLSLGTPQYMSPEQASGSPNIDARSDVYALGCVVYEMLVGEPPHSGPNPQAIMAKVLTQPVPHVREARDTVSIAMDGAIAKALAKLPADRFVTAQQFGEALQQSLTSDAIQSVAAPAAPRPRWQWPVAATLAVVVLGVLAMWGPWRGDGSPGTPAGVLQLTMETEPLAVVQHVPSSAVRWSPDGTQLAYVAGQGPVGQIYLRRLEGTTTAVPGAAGAQGPFFSPDGRWLGFVSGGKVRKVSLVDGSGVTLCDALELHGADWNQHGTIVLGANYGNLWGLSVVSSEGGLQEELLSVPGATNTGAPIYLLYPTWLPDGRAVLFTTADAGGIATDISVVEVETGEVHKVVDGGGAARYVSSGHIVYARDGALFAVPFDVSRRRVTGDPVRVADDVLTGGSYDPALAHFDVAPNGTLAYASGYGTEYVSEQLAWVDRTGTVEILEGLMTPGREPYSPFGPRVSPDGSRLLFWSPSLEWATTTIGQSGNVWTYDLEQRELRKISVERPDFFWSLWTPDGERIVSIGGQPGESSGNVYVRRVDGAGTLEQVTTAGPNQWNQPLSITADGEWVLYQVSTQGVSFDIWAVSLRTGEARPILVGPEDTGLPAISPDERWLAYTRFDPQGEQVFVTDFPEASERWRVAASGLAPLWSQDGKELYYEQVTPDGRTAMMALEVLDGPTFATGTLRKLFEGPFVGSMIFGRQYDVTADGERFLMIHAVGAVTNLQVVVNWFEALRRVTDD